MQAESRSTSEKHMGVRSLTSSEILEKRRHQMVRSQRHALNLHGRLTLTFRRRFGENFTSAPRSNNNGCGALSRSGTISQLMVCTILDSAETECESKGRINWGLLPWTSIPNLNLLQKSSNMGKMFRSVKVPRGSGASQPPHW